MGRASKHLPFLMLWKRWRWIALLCIIAVVFVVGWKLLTLPEGMDGDRGIDSSRGGKRNSATEEELSRLRREVRTLRTQIKQRGPTWAWPPPTMPQRERRRLAVVMPTASYQEARFWQFLQRGHTFLNLPSCLPNSSYTPYRDFWLYTNKPFGGSAETHAEKIEEIKQKFRDYDSFRCFNEVKFLCHNLSDEEDPTDTRSSSAIAEMFFNIFRYEGFKNYDYVYIMESDQHPVKPLWLDRMYEEVEYSFDDFWIKGSLYRGESLPADYCMNIYWGCGDHINGNAFYRLHDSQFTRFMMAVEKTRRIKGFNHDAHIMLTLRDTKNWRFFQRFAHKFVYTDFVQHRQNLVLEEATRRYANTFILHQPILEAEGTQEIETAEMFLDELNIGDEFVITGGGNT